MSTLIDNTSQRTHIESVAGRTFVFGPENEAEARRQATIATAMAMVLLVTGSGGFFENFSDVDADDSVAEGAAFFVLTSAGRLYIGQKISGVGTEQAEIATRAMSLALTGVAPAVSTLTASETIAAGSFANIHASSGAKVRKANATDATKPCNGFVAAGIANGELGVVQGPGTLATGLSGLTPGTTYYLSTTGGGLTATPPAGSGNLIQEIGVAVSATELFFAPQKGDLL